MSYERFLHLFDLTETFTLIQEEPRNQSKVLLLITKATYQKLEALSSMLAIWVSGKTCMSCYVEDLPRMRGISYKSASNSILSYSLIFLAISLNYLAIQATLICRTR